VTHLDTFRHYNGGQDHFEEHNRDLLGEINIPIIVKVSKKTMTASVQDSFGSVLEFIEGTPAFGSEKESLHTLLL
jgi:hypothetical protein